MQVVSRSFKSLLASFSRPQSCKTCMVASRAEMISAFFGTESSDGSTEFRRSSAGLALRYGNEGDPMLDMPGGRILLGERRISSPTGTAGEIGSGRDSGGAVACSRGFGSGMGNGGMSHSGVPCPCCCSPTWPGELITVM
jgi:hypothetical protein